MSAEDDKIGRPGGLVFAVLFLLACLFLLSQLGSETAFSATGKLFAQPRFWPAVGVIGMSVFGVLHLLGQVRLRGGGGHLWEAGNWLRSVEYLIWFMVYVFAAPVIGYLPATLIFTVALALRAGYRSKRMLVAAALTGLGVVLVFKSMLSVKIPGGAVYEYLPEVIRSFAIMNF